MLQDKVTQLSIDFGCRAGEVSELRSAAAGIQTLFEEIPAAKIQIKQKLSDPVVAQFSTEFNEFRKEVLTLKTYITAILPTVTPSQNEPPPPSSSTPQPLRSIRRFRYSILGAFQVFRRSSESSGDAVFTSVAGQPRWFQINRISPPM
jgi:hypothetical protein